MDKEIAITKRLRPCMVNGQKAAFHCWEHRSEIVQPSLVRGGHSGGVISATLGIIEREDGSVHKAYPEEIVFLDKEVGRIFANEVPPLDMKGDRKENEHESCNNRK